MQITYEMAKKQREALAAKKEKERAEKYAKAQAEKVDPGKAVEKTARRNSAKVEK